MGLQERELGTPRENRRGRDVWADNLKVALVTGVIVAHAVMAWTGVGNWVLTAPPVREPLRGVLMLLALIGAMFGMPLFFALAGLYTPDSLARKGLRRFLLDRVARLGVPLLVFVVLLAPVVEYFDDSNRAWDGGLWSFILTVVWWPPLRGVVMPPAWGPAWFLAVLLLLSALYVAVGSYLVRLAVPLGEEWMRLAIGQAPAWVVGFTLGVAGGERGWFAPVAPALARRARQAAGVTVVAVAATMSLAVLAGTDIEVFAGGGMWQSFVAAGFEGILAVTMPLAVIDLFRRRFDRHGRLGRQAGRAAFAAFLVHQVVLVLLVVAALRWLPWPPAVELVLTCVVAVLGSFALGSLLVRLPHVSRII